jgi:hypothetical protein
MRAMKVKFRRFYILEDRRVLFESEFDYMR